MSFIVFDNLIEVKEKEKEKIKSKDIICPKCKGNVRMNINEYKIKFIKMYKWT